MYDFRKLHRLIPVVVEPDTGHLVRRNIESPFKRYIRLPIRKILDGKGFLLPIRHQHRRTGKRTSFQLIAGLIQLHDLCSVLHRGSVPENRKLHLLTGTFHNRFALRLKPKAIQRGGATGAARNREAYEKKEKKGFNRVHRIETVGGSGPKWKILPEESIVFQKILTAHWTAHSFSLYSPF